MVEERDGWFVVNVKDAKWRYAEKFGYACGFEKEGQSFPQTGVHLFVLEPGKPNCRYHREEAQEDLLVLSGSCKLLVNGEERKLSAWDYVHLPAGTSHVCVGDEGPCAVLIIGHRPEKHQLHYPKSDLAKRYDAETPEETGDPRVAYSDAGRREECPPPKWPMS